MTLRPLRALSEVIAQSWLGLGLGIAARCRIVSLRGCSHLAIREPSVRSEPEFSSSQTERKLDSWSQRGSALFVAIIAAITEAVIAQSVPRDGRPPEEMSVASVECRECQLQK